MSKPLGILQQEANELQDNANILQQKMIDVIDRNNDVTSTHNTIMRRLTWVIVVLTIITLLWTNYNRTGRYAISAGGYVLDTKTSQMWKRDKTITADMGTNEKPIYKWYSTEEIEEKTKNNK
ncbi:MAG: hypothetical protein IIC01_03725 [Planctomycetes bacterium]|nr:hypothetical protein [Planctomycetota bacterium]